MQNRSELVSCYRAQLHVRDGGPRRLFFAYVRINIMMIAEILVLTQETSFQSHLQH